MKTIFHIEECDKWEINLERVNNVLDYQGDSDGFQTVIIVNGEAAQRLKEKEAKRFGIFNELKKITDKADIVVCNTTLENENIKAEELCSFVSTIPNYIDEIISKQNEGFAYVKS